MDFSSSGLFSSLLISSLGAGLLIYGKKAEKPLYLGIGLAMCVYPYFITSPLILWPLTIGLLIPLYTLRHNL